MNHLTDKQLDRWLQSKEHFDRDEASYISEHLESCHYCQEKITLLEAYYNDLDTELGKSPGEKDRTIASKIYESKTTKHLPGGSPNQLHQNLLNPPDNSLIVNVKNRLQKNPVASASITAGTILVAALLFIIQPWQQTNTNPTYAEVQRNILKVYNEEGEPIWNMVADGIPNETNSEKGGRRYIRVADIDGDDINEVLITGNVNDGKFTQNTVYCYNNDGTLRWKQHPPPSILYGKRKLGQVTTWYITNFFSINAPDDKPQLFVTSNSSWFPSVLFELNAENGEILQTYYHPGYIWTSEVYKMENSGRHLILLGTTNNTYQKAALAVLDPNNIDGHAPLTSPYKPKETSRADEMYYIMFKP